MLNRAPCAAAAKPIPIRTVRTTGPCGRRRIFPAGWASRSRHLRVYLLNLVHLRPGQGTFQPAGTLHAYLEGVNVELMANSDNVLRGGLTTKHVDVPELLSILTFDGGTPQVLDGEPVSSQERVYRTPSDEFELSRIALPPHGRYAGDAPYGPKALLVLHGSALVTFCGPIRISGRGDRSLLCPAAHNLLSRRGQRI